jgi:NTP pyrophosphatase (non-canonical NTP hydrolase)
VERKKERRKEGKRKKREERRKNWREKNNQRQFQFVAAVLNSVAAELRCAVTHGKRPRMYTGRSLK